MHAVCPGSLQATGCDILEVKHRQVLRVKLNAKSMNTYELIARVATKSAHFVTAAPNRIDPPVPANHNTQ
jgi:hypothetical protein